MSAAFKERSLRTLVVSSIVCVLVTPAIASPQAGAAGVLRTQYQELKVKSLALLERAAKSSEDRAAMQDERVTSPKAAWPKTT